ncbi:MAG: ISAs1 family transposase [Oscillospiraceae bacterium]|nr:ISAs1 family transposase [Oscillospiraceae bacterium]
MSWLPEAAEWERFRSVGMVRSTVTRNEETSVEIRYFISSLDNLDRFAYAVRKHWSIENQLHWCLDVIFREDASQARKDNSPLNLNVLRKVALALCKNTDMGKRVSIKKKRFRASLNPDAALSILLG